MKWPRTTDIIKKQYWCILRVIGAVYAPRKDIKTMNNNLKRLIEPGTRLFFFFLVVFAAFAWFFKPELAYIEGGVVVILLVYSVIANRRRQKKFAEYIESVTYDVAAVKNDSLVNFPLPMVAFKLENGAIVWGNKYFFELFGSRTPRFDARLTDLLPDFRSKWLLEGKQQYPELIEIGGCRFRVYGNIVRGENENSGDFMGMTYWMDVTEYDETAEEFQLSRPVAAIIIFDNLDEISRNQPDRVKAELQNMVSDRIDRWCSGMDGIVCRYDRDKYLFIFEQRHYDELTADKFSLLENVHEVINPSGVHATVSIGIGRDGSSFEETFAFAKLSAEMALTRGGDQAVVKNRFNFDFFGGRGDEVETRTKVKSRVMANALTELIKVSGQILIMGHRFGDMDCIGGGIGLCCIARKLGCRAHIVVDESNNGAGRLIQLIRSVEEYREAFISPQEAIMRADRNTLLIVIDTNRPEQVEDQSLLSACNRVAVIDHHRRTSSYIQNAALTFLEPYASSVCELICELMQEICNQSDILRAEADAVLAGIVLDTKNFTLRTGERTFDAAAFLRRMGADTVAVKKILQNDFDDTVARYNILKQVKRYRDNIAVAIIEEPQDRIVAAQAADEMLSIIGIQASLVIYPTEKGGVIISARSIGDVNVQVLLEELGGGGNKSAAGLQMENISLRDAANKLFAAIDKYFEE